MKKIIRKLTVMMCTICAMAPMTSCDDFLNIMPLNEVVLENYWENEDEVNSVVASCYSAMTDYAFMERVLMWGELRSDNVIQGSSYGEEWEKLMEGNILPTYGICNWASFYNVINLCNTVLHYGPKVLDRDPDFHESEWLALRSEVLSIRALCYFYLARTFRDVPLVLEPTIDDSKSFHITQSSHDVVMQQVLDDLLLAEPTAVKEFYKDTYTKGRITQIAVWSMLADVYLWMENYDKCIEYCDKVIAQKVEEAEKDAMRYDGNYPLLANQNNGSVANKHAAYYQIFGTGNSFESIFELQFAENIQVNGLIENYFVFLQGAAIARFQAAHFIGENMKEGNTVWAASDVRATECVRNQTTTFPIMKYAAINIDDAGTNYLVRDQNYVNWIFYRLTDVMLMQAEALVERNDSADIAMAYDLYASVYNRANLKSPLSAYEALESAPTRQQMRENVLAERQRELMFEGKRWFDLVRKARRDGTNNAMLNLATRKYTNPGSVSSKWMPTDMLYLPVYEEELKVNPLLEQNEAYITDETITTAK